MSEILTWVTNITKLTHMPKVGVLNLIEILILTITLYYLAKSLKDTRAWIILKGIFILFLFYAIAYAMKFEVIVMLFQNIIMFIGIAIVIIVQPELRRIIEAIGTKSINMPLRDIFNVITRKKNTDQIKYRISDKTIQEIVKGCSIMGKAKTGVLIVIEGDVPLTEYVDSGIKVNADITSQLLINIFEKNTPLHDGAVIIQNDRITAATCYLPLSDNKHINKDLGTRHRAGIGMTEASDSLVVIVSEETGAISTAYGGKLKHNLDREGLQEELKKIQVKTSKKVEAHHHKKIEHNLPLKIASLACSIFVWFVVITNSNPVISTTLYNVPITILNENYITDTGKAYDILSGDKVNVKLKDRKNVLDTIGISDVNVIADLSKLSITNAVQLEVALPKYPNTEVSLSSNTINVSLEDIITAEVEIDVDRVGSIRDGLYINMIETNPKTLMITGAKSLVNTIGKVSVVLDESMLESNSTIKAIPEIYDKNGELLNNSRFTLNTDEVEIDVALYNTKRVPLNIDTIVKNPIVSSIIDSISCDTTEITIVGPDEVLQEYKSIDIEIPIEISLGEISKNQFIRNINIQDYMPEGLLVDASQSRVGITINFIQFYTHELNYNSSSISIENIEPDVAVTIEDCEISTVLVNTSAAIDDRTIETIKPYIDASNLIPGEYDIKIQYRGYNKNIVGTDSVKVIVTEKPIEETKESE